MELNQSVRGDNSSNYQMYGTAVMKVETDIITSISVSLIGKTVMLVIMYDVFNRSLYLNFFSPTCPKAKKFLFIQTNSFIIFTSPNPVLLVPGFGQVG